MVAPPLISIMKEFALLIVIFVVDDLDPVQASLKK
jgi:hypothetical protein